MSYVSAIHNFLQHQESKEGILVIQPDGTWAHYPEGHTFELGCYHATENPTEALLEVARDLDNLNARLSKKQSKLP